MVTVKCPSIDVTGEHLTFSGLSTVVLHVPDLSDEQLDEVRGRMPGVQGVGVD
jgi:hypothetical protein